MEMTLTQVTEIPLSLCVINLGAVDRIPLGEGREYEVVGELVAVFRERSGALHAVQATCPHRGGALADGLIGAGKVVCPMHTFKYELSTGKPVGHDCAALKTYRISVNSDGEILLSL
jgi:nitrite reductase (NADH) small subunit